jgi:hypothetical protein
MYSHAFVGLVIETGIAETAPLIVKELGALLLQPMVLTCIEVPDTKPVPNVTTIIVSLAVPALGRDTMVTPAGTDHE